MVNTNSKIELKRGIRRICKLDLVDIIADLPNFECFYSDIFSLYNVPYNTATIMQKRCFVASVTKYFIFDRLPKGTVGVDDDGDYICINCSTFKDAVVDTINKFYEIYNDCKSDSEFKDIFAKYYNEEVRDFSNEISQNRDNSLSDFTKAVEKVANYKDDTKSR